MIQSSLELTQAVQSDYEREVKQVYLRKQIPRTKSRLVTKLEWLGKDIMYFVFRLIARKHNSL